MGKGFPAAVDEAEDLGNTALQMFTHNPSQWRIKPIAPERAEAFLDRRKDSAIRYAVAHTMYLLNLASPDDALHEKSIDALTEEVRRAGQLRLEGIVTHLGAHVGSGKTRGIGRIVEALDRVRASAAFEEAGGLRVLLENTAGSGTTIGEAFEDLAEILSRLEDPEAFGVCLDTAHAFAAGYDLRSLDAVEATLEAFDRTVGGSRLGLIHLNDSKYALASRRDRHEHIGHGEIGSDGLGALIQHPDVEGVPIILETPKEIDGREDADRMNLATVRMLVAGAADEGEER